MTPQELRASILQQAIQGKLVEQRPEEGTGEELFHEIQAEKQTLIKARKIKKESALPEITEDDILFEIPESWRWCYVGDLFNHNTGKAMNASAKKSDKPGSVRQFITTSNLYWDSFDFTTVKEMFFTDDEIARCSATKNDILICEGGAYYGRTAIWTYDYDICFQNHVHRLRAYRPIVEKFFYYIFRFYRENGKIQAKGTAMPGLSSIVLHTLVIPLPPYAEQKRIVARLEEILPLIDRYEAAWNKLEEFNMRFPGDMQKSILQLAIQGKLVEQRPEEGTGEELFQQIQSEKQALIKAGKIKKEKPLPDIAEDEIPFDIPETWKWVRLGDVASINGGFAFKSTNYTPTGVRVVRISDFNECGFVNDNIVRHPYDESLSQYVLDIKNILLCMTGGTVGKSLFVTELDERMVVNQRVATIKVKSILPDYVYQVILAPITQKVIQYSKNSTNDNISMDTIKNFLIPLPPLEEQRRIVAKLEEILPLCERLK